MEVQVISHSEAVDSAPPKLAVVGCGWWSTQFHIPGIQSFDGAELVGIVDSDVLKRQATSDIFGVPSFGSIKGLKEAVEVDGVVIATTSATHYDLALEALMTDLHVMVEKPMVLRSSEAWELVDIAARKGLVLQVGLTHHYTSSAQRLHQVIANGGIGEILHVSGLYATMVEAYYRGRPEEFDKVFHFPVTGPGSRTYSDPAIAGGGQGVTQVSHLIGMILWVTGLRVVEISAFMENTDLAVDLVDAISFRLDSGGVGVVGSTGNLRPGDPQQQEIRYYGTKGYALQDLVTARAEIRYEDGEVETLTIGEAEEPYPAYLPARELANAIRGVGKDVASGESGARSVEFLEAAYESARNHAFVEIRKDRAATIEIRKEK